MPDEAQEAVDRLAETLQRSVVVNDPGVRLLHASRHFGDEDEVRVQAVLQRQAPSRAVGHVLAQGVTAWHGPGVVPALPEIGMDARVCVPVRWRGQLVGLLMVMDPDSTLTTGELARIDAAAHDLGAVIAARREAETLDASVRTALAELTDPDPGARRRANAVLAALPDADRFRHVVALSVGVHRNAETQSSHVDLALEHALRAAGSGVPTTGTLAVVHDGTGLLLLGSSTPLSTAALDAHAAAVVRRATELAAGRFQAVAGIGAGSDGLGRADATARQAVLARTAATHRDPVASWSGLGARGPLLLLAADLVDDAVLPDELQRVRAVDGDGLLTRTLAAYLDSGCSGPGASAALSIHRTTLYYRLGRITDLTGLDLADGRTRLALHLGLTLLDVHPGAFDNRRK